MENYLGVFGPVLMGTVVLPLLFLAFKVFSKGIRFIVEDWKRSLRGFFDVVVGIFFLCLGILTWLLLPSGWWILLKLFISSMCYGLYHFYLEYRGYDVETWQ
jgi:hypothetical protein